ncbi:MAG: antibiotic biosynthesis monooxygenase [Actinomycetia bacterium]|nr:antibiotic biosynthesis monooxygenase [Actinomycetes bacterium]
MPAVAFVSTRWVDPEWEPDYVARSAELEGVLADVPGYVSAEVLPAEPGSQDFWTHIIRFEDKESSQAWAHSPELAEFLRDIDGYTHDSETSAVRTGKADWLNFGFSSKPGPGAPVKWKQILAGVTVLYPTVVLAHEALGALVTLPFAASTLVTNAIAMSFVMTLGLPTLSKLLGFWLLPKAPLPLQITVGVSVGLLLALLVMLLIFGALFQG